MGRVLATLAVAVPSLLVSAAAPERPAGWSDRSYYLAMRDGTKIAVSLYYPVGLKVGEHYPVLLVQTRYGRAKIYDYARPWLARGYLVAVIDTRGSTASFGKRRGEITPDEVSDMDEVIAHLAALPQSNGQVIASGVSYMADTADVATSRPVPALLGAIPREADFDAYTQLFFPGGVANAYMMEAWGDATRALDHGQDGRGLGLDCQQRQADCAKLFPALQPTDEDPDFNLLRQALAGRERWTAADFRNADFRDDRGQKGYSLFGSSPGSMIAAIREQNKPVQYWGSWMDAGTAAAAIARYQSAPQVPTEVWITANDHNHRRGADPFFPDRAAPSPSLVEQAALNINFADRLRAGHKPARTIHYYVLGDGRFRQTSHWPPAGTRLRSYRIDANGQLSPGAVKPAWQDYAVDYTATTGKATRWSTNFGISPVYGDRRLEDRKLATWTSTQMPRALELTGTPTVTITLTTATSDPALFVYLEDVSPYGRVTYLTEGQLRLIHRKPAGSTPLPYVQGPAAHSYRRADALPVRPGVPMTVSIALFPVSAKIEPGHRIRMAIAGADADTFKAYPAARGEHFRIRRGGAEPTRLELPVRTWTEAPQR